MTRRFVIAGLAVMALAASTAQSAQAAPDDVQPCATQQALFDKYGIGLNMYSPEVSWAYNTVCGVTG